MSDKLTAAKKVFATLCKAMDELDWHYDILHEELGIRCSVTGDDIPVKLLVFVDAETQLIRLFSPMSFHINEDKRVEAAVAVGIANHGLINGNFDYDLSDGTITFRLVNPFHESEISVSLITYMIDVACHTVDRYNDRFLMLNKGVITLADFHKDENQ